jgi:hypothetical protein
MQELRPRAFLSWRLKERQNQGGFIRMKLIVLNLLILFAFGSFAVQGAQAAENVRVQVNHQARAARAGIRVRFVEMVEDSRCPTDVNCIQAGNAKITIEVSKNGRSKTLELYTNSMNGAAIFAGYRFELRRLTPEPRSNVRINRNGYVATIRVERNR